MEVKMGNWKGRKTVYKPVDLVFNVHLETQTTRNPNNQKLMDDFPNNHLLCEGVPLPYWSNQLFLVGAGFPGSPFLHTSKAPSPSPRGRGFDAQAALRQHLSARAGCAGRRAEEKVR